MEEHYSNGNMSDNYAMIAMYVEEKDLVVTIAEMVRFNAKTYPAPTPVNYFEKHRIFIPWCRLRTVRVCCACSLISI